MIVRIWRTGVRADRVSDYEQFARTRSLPMFRRREGCLGVLFAADAGERIVITLWDGPESVDRLAESTEYRETVDALSATGILEGEQSVQVFNSTGGFVEPGITIDAF
ncbi:hypothetical protein GCM10009630_10360 [Kribbella jejuensis]|uniref:ABM domain-containing protein n=1 Tax=Kribbella jejuensis TaxID=236068 RepID=A0A542EA75_9ACTN|nr:hypothetical protein [Kribbella jejuensis]TQJ12221.1 hypothetical protein FB475_5151 [Kribbella jejuensis]